MRKTPHSPYRLTPPPCYAVQQDKVNLSVAIIPMAQDFGWSPTVAGVVQSAFFWGYMVRETHIS